MYGLPIPGIAETSTAIETETTIQPVIIRVTPKAIGIAI
jgi:hypothetical protein